MATRLLLIRHAHVHTGRPPRLCGTYDLPLSPKGRQQLDALAALRGGAPPDALYSSPLLRATETAAVISRIWGINPTQHRGFAEIHCGELEGVQIPQIQEEHPDLWQRNMAQTDDLFTWPGGESYAAFRQRILDSLAGIAAAHTGERVAIVTHSGVIAQVLGTIKGRRAAIWEHDRPDPLTATEVVWKNGGPLAMLRYNVRHWL